MEACRALAASIEQLCLSAKVETGPSVLLVDISLSAKVETGPSVLLVDISLSAKVERLDHQYCC